MRLLRLILLPLIVPAVGFLAWLGFLVLSPRRLDELEEAWRKNQPQGTEQTAEDQEESDKHRRFLVDMSDGKGFAATLRAFAKQSFEPSESEEEWRARKLMAHYAARGEG